MKNLGQMLKQAQEMQGRMAEMQEELERIEIEGRAGGGMVTVKMTAKGKLTGISIDPSLMAADERETLEDLIMAAHADARDKAQARMAEEMKKLTGGMPLPDGFQLPF